MNSLFSHLALFSFILICSVVTTPGPQQNGEDSNEKADKKTSKSLVNRMKEMLESGKLADVLFSFGKGAEKKFLPAHKCVLCVFSNVFKDMFPSDEDKLTDEPNEKVNSAGEQKMSMTVVDIPDIDADVFKTMLQFIYWEDLGGVNGNNLMKVFYAAKIYKIIGLVEACIAFPLKKITQIFLTYAQAHENGGKELADRCLAYIDQNAERMIHSNEFLEIDKELLTQILGRDQLVVKDELSIWNAALRWADYQCKQNGNEISKKTRNEMLGSAMYNIRFPLIPQQDFNKIVLLVYLPSEDMKSIYESYPNEQNALPNDGKKRYLLKFSTKPRNYFKPGRIGFTIDKFSEFNKSKEGTQRLSNALNVSGLAWKILAIHNENDAFTFHLQTDGVNDKFTKWSRKCAVTLRITAQKEGKNDLIKEFQHTFDSALNTWGHCFVTFQQLKDNGWYNEEKDSVAFVADFIVIDPK